MKKLKLSNTIPHIYQYQENRYDSLDKSNFCQCCGEILDIDGFCPHCDYDNESDKLLDSFEIISKNQNSFKFPQF